MPEEILEFIAPASGERLDKLIVAEIGDRLSRAQIQALIAEGRVMVNEKMVKAGHKLRGGEQIQVTIPSLEARDTVEAESIDLKVLYDDAYLAVIDKPAGMVVHPGVANERGTLVAAMLARWPEIAQMDSSEKRMGIVHRLDKDTSGLIVIAKSEQMRRRLMAQFQARTVEKVYLALVEKKPPTRSGRIDAPIGRDPDQRKRMSVVRAGRPAISEYSVMDDHFREDRALLRVQLLTGRTHQIRVHLAFIGCPIVGDRVYGYRKQRSTLNRQFLHAAELAFDHPHSGVRMRFESPLPDDLVQAAARLRPD